MSSENNPDTTVDASQKMSNRWKLMAVLGLIAILGLVTSLLVKMLYFDKEPESLVYLGVAVPVVAEARSVAESLVEGAQLFVDHYNENDEHVQKLAIKVIPLNTVDTFSTRLREVEKEQPLIGVVGHSDADMVNELASLYEELRLPLIAIPSLLKGTVESSSWVYSSFFNSTQQATFIANYIRNVMGDKIVTIVHDDTSSGRMMAQGYTALYEKFGTRINYTFELSADIMDSVSLNTLITQLKEKKDAGTIFLATSATRASQFVKQARDIGIRNQIAGTDVLTTRGFVSALEQQLQEEERVEQYTDRLITSTPLLFDTAGERAQQFRNQYINAYQQSPDWIAAFAYDSASLIGSSLSNQKEAVTVSRNRVKRTLEGLQGAEEGVGGVTGRIHFDKQGEGLRPVQIGLYNGSTVVAALTQLQPIKKGSSANYLEELKAGRMLYVNDRFMYKTNVVYTGLEVLEISDIDMATRTAEIEFSIWFRYRGKGKFDPADVDFLNAVEPVSLGEPVEEKDKNRLNFRLYRAKGHFLLDFVAAKRSFGRHIVGISFRHKQLSRNNVSYVVDILGLGYDQGGSLKERMDRTHALSPVLGWAIDRAWISQEMEQTPTFGRPSYVGYGAVDPLFSRIDLGIMISRDSFDLRDWIDSEYLIYIGIFGLVGILVSGLLDRMMHGIFWVTATWFLRVIFWPLFLMSIGNVVLDHAVQADLALQQVHLLTMLYEMVWWMLPAWLIAMALNRFVWDPLERKAQKKIPNVIRLLVSSIAYLLAFLGVVAFVFNQHLTSLLATGGLFTMIIGLAMQGNIANIFSGIIVNIEKPFVVGDWIRIGDMEDAEVIDVTWRALRLRTIKGNVIIIPNDKVSTAMVINFTMGNARIDIPLELAPKYEPDFVLEMLNEVLGATEGIHEVEPPSSIFVGVETLFNQQMSKYIVRFWLKDYSTALGFKLKVWNSIWHAFKQNGITFAATDAEELMEHE